MGLACSFCHRLAPSRSRRKCPRSSIGKGYPADISLAPTPCRARMNSFDDLTITNRSTPQYPIFIKALAKLKKTSVLQVAGKKIKTVLQPSMIRRQFSTMPCMLTYRKIQLSFARVDTLPQYPPLRFPLTFMAVVLVWVRHIVIHCSYERIPH